MLAMDFDRPASVLVADGNAIFRAGLTHILRSAGDQITVHEAATSDEMYGVLTSDGASRFDLVVADLALAEPCPGEMMARTERRGRRPVFVLIGATETPAGAHRALAAGARGFIGKDAPPQIIVQAIRLVLAGGVYMPPCLFDLLPPPGDAAPDGDARLHPTGRQREVLVHLARGSSNKEIARSLGLSESAIKANLATLMRMLGARNRTDAVLRATERGWMAGGSGEPARGAPIPVESPGPQPVHQP